MANFKVVEGDDPLERIHDDFIRLYEGGVRVKDICTQLNISNSQYQNFRMRLNRRGELTVNRNPKNYHWNRETKSFHVVHCGKFYARLHDEEQARDFVRLMRECDWDYTRRFELKEKVME